MDIKTQLIALTDHFVVDSSSRSIMAYNGNGEYFDLPEKNELALIKLLSFHGIELPVKAIKNTGICFCSVSSDKLCPVHRTGTVPPPKQECCSDGMCHRCNP